MEIFLPDPVNKQDPLAQGLIGFWLGLLGLDGGKYLYDIVGNHHGVLTNGPKWVESSRPGGYGAISFDGTDDYVDISTSLVFDAPFTLAFWVRPTATNTGWYVSDSSGVAGNNGLACILGFQAGQWNIYRDSGFGGFYPTGTSTDSQMVAAGAGIWDFVVWTWDGARVLGYTSVRDSRESLHRPPE
jgi:hypothetical protein